MSGLPPLPGDPAAVRLLADRLTTSARRLAGLAGVLARLRDTATWEGPAGDAFGARLREATPVLDAVAQRLGGAAAPLRSLAVAMEEAQVVIGASVRDDDEAEHAYAVLEDRAFALVCAGSGEDSPDLMLVRHLQREQTEVGVVARARHAAAVERFREADRRCARALAALSVDGLADSLPYRALVGAGSVGHGLASLGIVAAAVPWLRPVAAVGEGIGLGADAGLLLAYREGDAVALAAGAALGATGAAGGVLRRGAVQGARRSATGVTVTRHLTAQERLRLGAVAEVRQRRDDLRRRFAVLPDRGTPSALLGGPPVRLPRAPAAGGGERNGGGPLRAGGPGRPGTGTGRSPRGCRVPRRLAPRDGQRGDGAADVHRRGDSRGRDHGRGDRCRRDPGGRRRRRRDPSPAGATPMTGVRHRAPLVQHRSRAARRRVPRLQHR